MRLLLYIFILVLIMGAGLFLQQNTGDIDIVYQNTVISMPLWMPVIGSITVLFILTLVYSFFSAIARTYRRFRDWLTGSTFRAIASNSNQGWTALVEGDWHKSETSMLKAAKHSEYPLHFYLTAARAAQEQSAIDRRDNYLHLAAKSDPSASLAVGLTQAELQIKQEQYEFCLATLHALQKSAPHNVILLKLMADLFVHKADWLELIKLLPQLKKYSVLPSDDYATVELQAYRQALRKDKQLWEELPKNIKANTNIVAEYAQSLLDSGQVVEAESLIRNTLKRDWDLNLVRLYGLAIGPDISKQIANAETWLQNHRSEPVLLLTLARLCLAHKLWGKARSYLEASLAIQANADAYAELGRLLGFLGEQQKSLDCYRNGLMSFASVLQLEGIQK